MAAQLTPVRFFTLVHRGDVDGKVVFLTEPFLAQRTGVGAVLLVNSFDVLFQVVLPLEPVRADRADVRLCTVGFFVYRRLMRLHDVCPEVMPLKKTLIAQMTAVRFDLLFQIQGEK